MNAKDPGLPAGIVCGLFYFSPGRCLAIIIKEISVSLQKRYKGASAMGKQLQHFIDKFEEFRALPAGESFTIKVTDREATAAANEFVTEQKTQIREFLKQSTGFGLDISDPAIDFLDDGIILSAKGGKGFLKANASITADVRWDDGLAVNVRSVDVPFISVSPQKLNSAVKKPLSLLMAKVGEYAEIRAFVLMYGCAVLEAVRK